ncbi:helix-turn-helix transcriptional regulator [Streptomyces poonensis]|uniref:HTH araC/xylS-type domain-containing protein n=1 Tax=Streptomyces poonensis TaxID=68255 RepID=A0A918UG05_9ACTN|nr:helix-turn-helix transcriptional regulator [Streptomyces poonensis]GGZ02752.1 hypothetical protein GCM10010365_21860 [Streptomyces poonensis]GLJ93802.1 hypothetical protein GCM10017589_64190 [Streptomyces poonensis]
MGQPTTQDGTGPGQRAHARFLSLRWLPQSGNEECLYVGLHSAGPESLVLDGRHLTLERGDLLLAAGSLPPRLTRYGDRLTFFQVPCSHLGVPADDVRSLTDRHVSGGDGIAALVSQLLTALAAAAEPHAARTGATGGGRLALNALDLITVLVQDLLSKHRPVVSTAADEMLGRVQQYIGEHLGDSGMSPETIARAHHISVRYLHKLFRSDGTTVGAWIRQHRLEVCRLELSRPSGRRRTVAAVAQSWGFTSPSHFSRLFKETYGMSPKEWQELALREAPAWTWAADSGGRAGRRAPGVTRPAPAAG